MNVFKSCYTLGVIFATAQLLSAQTVYSPYTSRVVGQAILQQQAPFTAGAPNLVEGRELFLPEGIAVDNSATPPILYVADTLNNRVLAWKNASSWQNGQPADLVIGQRDQYSTAPKGPGTDLTQGLNQPSGAAVDKNGNLYVADSGNNRIVRYPTPFRQTQQPLPIDLVLGQKDLNSRGGNQGSQTGPTATTLSISTQLVGMVFDSSGNLWVSDGLNNRVLRYPAASLGSGVPFDPAADLVLGHSDYTTAALPAGSTALSKNVLNQPGAMAFSPGGQLFVADSGNRVLVYVNPSTAGQQASRIMGIPTSTAANPNPAPISESTLRNPNGIFFIGDNPFVVDSGNNRILQYDPFALWPPEPSGTNPPAGSAFSPPAKKVFGQGSFAVGTANSGVPQPTDISFSTPTAAVYVGSELLLADSGNNRVLAIPYTGGLFLHASRVLGQVDFKYNALNLIEGREFDLADLLHNASGGGVAIDNVSATPHLYVADVFNNRVLGFNDARTVKPGQKADLVIGQPDFFTAIGNFPSGSATAPNDGSLLLPEGVAVDSSGNLWVADSGNGRVLRFPKPFDQPNTTQEKANLEIGQASIFSPRVTDASPQTMRLPYGIAFTGDGHLVVSDVGMNRILLFKKPAGGDFVNGQAASNVIGQPDFISTGTNELKSPTGIGIDANDRLYVADTGSNRVVVYPNVTTSGNDPAPSFSLLGSGSGDHFNNPEGVTLDPHTLELWVADTGGSRVVRFPDYDGLTLGQTSNLQFGVSGPVAMTVDQFGDPIIAEGGANRIGFYYRAISTGSGNAANYFFRFSPGMLASLFPSLQSSFGSETVTNSQIPVPTTLGDVQVLVAGTPAPLIYVSPKQINFQIPNATPAGSPAEIDVVKASTGQILATWLYRIDQFSPGLFTSDATGRGQLAAINEDGSFNDANHPAKSGSNISFYGTGYGFIPGLPPDGTPPTTAISTTTTPTVAINQSLANVTYSGVAPGFIGLWQINVVVPANMPPAQVSVGINMAGALSTLDPSNNRIFTNIYVKP